MGGVIIPPPSLTVLSAWSRLSRVSSLAIDGLRVDPGVQQVGERLGVAALPQREEHLRGLRGGQVARGEQVPVVPGELPRGGQPRHAVVGAVGVAEALEVLPYRADLPVLRPGGRARGLGRVPLLPRLRRWALPRARGGRRGGR